MTKYRIVLPLLFAVVTLLTCVSVLNYQQAKMEEPLVANGKKVEMYTTSSCGYCRQARNYFQEHNIAYTEYNLDGSPAYVQKFRQLGGQGVPLIFVNGVRMDGFDTESFAQLYR